MYAAPWPEHPLTNSSSYPKDSKERTTILTYVEITFIENA